MIAQDGGRDGSSAVLDGPSNEHPTRPDACEGNDVSNNPQKRPDGDRLPNPAAMITGTVIETTAMSETAPRFRTNTEAVDGFTRVVNCARSSAKRPPTARRCPRVPAATMNIPTCSSDPAARSSQTCMCFLCHARDRNASVWPVGETRTGRRRSDATR